MGNGNSPAYPLPIAGCTDGGVYNTMEKDCTTGGLTKREMFAMAAMQGLMAIDTKGSFNGEIEMIKEGARLAVLCADELLKQLEK